MTKEKPIEPIPLSKDFENLMAFNITLKNNLNKWIDDNIGIPEHLIGKPTAVSSTTQKLNHDNP